ncbi:MAG: hypothetical protein Ct9H90mP28_0940 [Paracoccaceae bacterium]|nr:MAG: hypothetical protein Ct9H90mP28_0940 [Paracoccaceae bacterium]
MGIYVNRTFRKKSRKKTIGGYPPDNETLLNTFVQIKTEIHTQEQENVKINFFRLTHLNPYNNNVPSVHDMYYLDLDAQAEKYELLHISFQKFRRIGIGRIANSAYASLNHIARAYYNNQFDLTEKSVDGNGNIVTLIPYSENYLQDLKNMRQDLINANNGNNPTILNAIDNMTSEIEIIGHRVELFKTLIAIEGAKNIHRRKRESVNYQLASFPEDISNELAKFQFGGSNIPEPKELINIFLENRSALQNPNTEVRGLELYLLLQQKLVYYNNNVPVWNKYTLEPRMRNMDNRQIELIHTSFKRFKYSFWYVTPEQFANMHWGGFYTLDEKSVDSYGNVVNLLQYAEKYVDDLENNTDYTIGEKIQFKNLLDIIRTLSAIKDATNLAHRAREATNYELAGFPLDISRNLSNYQYGGGKKVLGQDLIEGKFYKVIRFQFGKSNRVLLTRRNTLHDIPRHILTDEQGRNRPYITYAKYISPMDLSLRNRRDLWNRIINARRDYVNTEPHDYKFVDEIGISRRIFEDIRGNIFIISENHLEGPNNEFHEILPSELENEIKKYPDTVARDELRSKSPIPEELIDTISDMNFKPI